MLLEAWIEIGLSTPPAVPGPGLLEHCPDQLMPTAGDTPDGAPLPDTELGHCRPGSAHQVVLCDPEAMQQEPRCQRGQPRASV